MTPQALLGKSALVTGGARRIGREIALTLAAAGADLTVTYRASEADAAETVRAIQNLGRSALAVECDVRSEASVRAAIAACISFHRRLDVLVNNAAVFESSPLDQISLAQWDAVLETNARGPFLVAREALSALRATQGRIVNIGSLGGVQAWAGHAHYCSSKAALHMLTQAMAKSFAPDVSVNCVAPGWIEISEGQVQASVEVKFGNQESANGASGFAARTPMQRNGTPSDVAQTVLFFASGPRFVTGQILTVDGGLGL